MGPTNTPAATATNTPVPLETATATMTPTATDTVTTTPEPSVTPDGPTLTPQTTPELSQRAFVPIALR